MNTFNWISLVYLSLGCVPAGWFLPLGFMQRRLYYNADSLPKIVVERRFRRRKPPANFDDMRNTIGGPKRNESYNPFYGYEPYWPESDWVFNRSTAGDMCGKTCFKIYEMYGEVCGMSPPKTTKGFYKMKTFKNYCYLLMADCVAETQGRLNWTLVYRGPCLENTKVYLNDSRNFSSRAYKYLQDWYRSSPTTIKYITTTRRPTKPKKTKVTNETTPGDPSRGPPPGEKG